MPGAMLVTLQEWIAWNFCIYIWKT